MTAHFRAARSDEAASLSAVAYQSKAIWGYTAEFLQACRAELTYTEGQIDAADCSFTVYEVDGDIAGFYALAYGEDGVGELEALFVTPRYIGRSIGLALLGHAKERAAAQGVRKLTIPADPNAASFYEAAGAIQIGERESLSIPGRFLPVYEIGTD